MRWSRLVLVVNALSLQCSSQQTESCRFGIPGPSGINVAMTTQGDVQRFGFRLVTTGTSFITASRAIFVEGVSLVYVAHDGVIEVVSIRLLMITATMM